MWHQLLLFMVSTSILTVYSIVIPIENKQDDVTNSTLIDNSNDTQENPNYNIPGDAYQDSYLIPLNPQYKSQEVLPDTVVTPATYLLPPSSEQDSHFFYPPTEAGEQSDWYPIAKVLPPTTLPKRQAVPIFLIENGPLKIQNTRVGKSHTGDLYTRGKPSIRLEPPPLNAPNEYILPNASEQLGIPLDQVKQENPYSYKIPYTDINGKVPYSAILLQNQRQKQEEKGLPLHLTPPKPLISLQKYPTNLYPKKYSSGFKPVPIPIAHFAEDALSIPRAKPLNYLQPVPTSELDFIPESEDKKSYLYKQAEQKRKSKYEEIPQGPPLDHIGLSDELQAVPVASEQETSETINRQPRPNIYSARIREAPKPVQKEVVKSPPAPDERTEFRMHGMKGPHSYQFGYDTGKGKNRQFRYEERDNDGQVRGHYGYMDKHGKLRVVNYSAHPELGFHAEAPVENE